MILLFGCRNIHAIRTAISVNHFYSTKSNIPNNERILNIPNILTMTRIVSAPFLAYCILHQYHLVSASLFILSASTDMLDGYLARRWNQQTRIGSIIDPLSDKVLALCTSIPMTFIGIFPWQLMGLIISRETMLMYASVKYRIESLSKKMTWRDFFNIKNINIQITPSMTSKCNTMLQGLIFATLLASPVLHLEQYNIYKPLISTLEWTLAGTTIWSSLEYYRGKGFHKI